jgi:hypothetical protein
MSVVVANAAGAYLQGGRQALLTPITFFLLAYLATIRSSSAEGEHAGRARTARKLLAMVLIAVLAVTSTALLTTAKRSAAETALHGGHRPSLVTSLVTDQTLVNALYVAVAREPRPQGIGIYERVLAAPVPRRLWPAKPLSYDFEFRARHFPSWGGGVPISIVGTSYVSLLLPGVVVAGLVVAALTAGAQRLFARGSPRAVLVSAAMLLLAIDLIRIGGLYRELITFVTVLSGVVLATRPTTRTRPASTASDEG